MSLRPHMSAAFVARWSSAPVRSRTPLASQLVPRRPLGFDAGDANLYRYVFNRPIGRVDPSGQGELRVVDRPSDDTEYTDEVIKDGADSWKDKGLIKNLETRPNPECCDQAGCRAHLSVVPAS